MVTTYRLKASELDQSFLEKLKATYGDQEIEISVSNLTTQLEAMANDPSIQAEIQQIEQEFKITEMDGLTNLWPFKEARFILLILIQFRAENKQEKDLC